MLQFFGYTKYFGDIIAIANLSQKVKSDNHPGVTAEQFQQFVDIGYHHVPANIVAYASKAETVEVLDAAEDLIEPLNALSAKVARLFKAIKALFSKS